MQKQTSNAMVGWARPPSLHAIPMLMVFLLSVLGAVSIAHAAAGSPNLFGVIEVGGSGIKATVYDMSPKQALTLMSDEATVQGFRYKAFKKAQVQNYQPFDTKLKNFANWPSAVDAIRGFSERMQREHGVPKGRIYVVASSSVREIKQFDILKTSVLEGTGLPLDAVTAERECKLTFRWLVPGNRLYQAVVIDVGSGNTKACYLEPGSDGDRFRSFELLPYGTKTFESEAQKYKKPGMSFSEASLAARRALLDPKIETQASGNSGLRTRKRLYLSGGASWVVTTYTHPEQIAEDWVRLSVPEDFQYVRIVSAENKQPEAKVASIGDAAIRTKMEKELAAVSNVFTPDQLVAGMDILIAVAEDLHVRTEKDVVFFPRPAVDAWRSRYLVEKIAQVGMRSDMFTP